MVERIDGLPARCQDRRRRRRPQRRRFLPRGAAVCWSAAPPASRRRPICGPTGPPVQLDSGPRTSTRSWSTSSSGSRDPRRARPARRRASRRRPAEPRHARGFRPPDDAPRRLSSGDAAAHREIEDAAGPGRRRGGWRRVVVKDRCRSCGPSATHRRHGVRPPPTPTPTCRVPRAVAVRRRAPAPGAATSVTSATAADRQLGIPRGPGPDEVACRRSCSTPPARNCAPGPLKSRRRTAVGVRPPPAARSCSSMNWKTASRSCPPCRRFYGRGWSPTAARRRRTRSRWAKTPRPVVPITEPVARSSSSSATARTGACRPSTRKTRC